MSKGIELATFSIPRPMGLANEAHGKDPVDIPNQIVRDNGTQFTSTHFELYMRNNDINHVTSPAFHQSSNGCAERAVKTVKTVKKRLLKNEVTANLFQRQVDQVLMAQRSTPNHTGVTPSERFIGRRIRTRLDHLKPKLTEPSSAILSTL